MENQNFKPLATESFSYSWLSSSDENPSPKFPEYSNDEQQSFDFDVPAMMSPSSSSSSNHNFIHADELFSGGQIKPVFIEKSIPEASRTSNSISAPAVYFYSPDSPFASEKLRSEYYFLGKLRKSSKKIARKWFGFLRPRKSNRVDDLERKVFEFKSWTDSCEASPRVSSAYSVFEWADVEKIAKSFDLFNGSEKFKSGKKSSRASPNISPSSNYVWSCDAENSIHEAILYCKRSIEN